MEANKEIIAATFALILISFFFVQSIYVISPALNEGIYATEESIATQIDALSSAGEGMVRLNIPKNMIGSVSISYETKGKKESYDIPQDGWYVVVSYRLGAGTMKGASLIRSYPKSAGLEKAIAAPSGLCVVKERVSPYAEVERC